MKAYKFKLNISRLECETYFSSTENHTFALKSVDEHQKKFRVGKRNMYVKIVNTIYFFIIFLLQGPSFPYCTFITKILTTCYWLQLYLYG